MNEYPPEMINDLADGVFARVSKLELIAVLISNALRQPRVHKVTATDHLDVRSSVG